MMQMVGPRPHLGPRGRKKVVNTLVFGREFLCVLGDKGQLDHQALTLLAGDAFLLWRILGENSGSRTERGCMHPARLITERIRLGTKVSASWRGLCSPAGVSLGLMSCYGRLWKRGVDGRWKQQEGGQAEGTDPKCPVPLPGMSSSSRSLCPCRSPSSSLPPWSLHLSTWCWCPSWPIPSQSSCMSSCSCSVASRSISCLSTSGTSPGVCRWSPCISSCSWKLLQPRRMLTEGLDRSALPLLL